MSSRATASRRRCVRAVAAMCLLTGLLASAGTSSASAAFELSLVADTNAARDGQTLTFTATTKNNGPASSVNMRITMAGGVRAESEFLYLSHEASGLASCSGTYPGSTTVVCYGTLANEASATLTVHA
jgi:Domain of unknown function DUF11